VPGSVACPEILLRGRGSTNLVEDRGEREQGYGGGSPLVRGSAQRAKSETYIRVRLLQVYFPPNWNFGAAVSKFRNFGTGGGCLNPLNPTE
jgi:hypothetical protein